MPPTVESGRRQAGMRAHCQVFAALAGVMVAAMLAACSSGSPPATRSVSPVPSPAATVASSGSPVPTPPPATASVAPSAAASREPIGPGPGAVALEPVASGLDGPIGIAAAPGGWLLISEQRGRLVALDPASGRTAEVVDLADRVSSGGERGLLGVALAPDWPSDPRAFVHYTDLDGDTVISALPGAQPGDGPPTLDRDGERVLLRVDQPYENHNGGQLAFGPDGYLYIGLGDGGAGGDPLGNGQDPTTLLGSVLRVDVGGDQLAIPADNPFADGRDGAPEVFLYGLRNPWRFSFDRLTGQLWIGDVGQASYEEVDRVDPRTDAGANLGWNLMEGSHCFVEGCSPDGLVLPVGDYGRAQGCSVIGGHVYRGSAVAGLDGWYVFGDFCSGIVFGIRSDATPTTAPHTLLDSDLAISAFGEGSDGELYVADMGGGTIYRIASDGG